MPPTITWVADHHVTAKRSVVYKNNVVADLTVVGDVAPHHYHAIITDPGLHAASGGAGVERRMLADYRAGSDNQFRRLAGIFQVLGTMPD